MNNKIIFFLSVAFVLVLHASGQDQSALRYTRDEATGLITYKEVVEQEGTKDTLFNRCSSWLHKFYANPWDATKVRDQATGLIKIQHQFRIYDYDETGNKTDAGMILYNAKIEFKDNKYRIVVDNFVLKQVSRYPVEKWLERNAPDYDIKWENYLKQIDDFVINDLFASLKENMKPDTPVVKDEW